MIHKIHCPGCQVALQVPLNTVGCWVRCPACRHRFQVPKPEVLIEETISTWIEEDLEQEFQQRRQQHPQALPEEMQVVGAVNEQPQEIRAETKQGKIFQGSEEPSGKQEKGKEGAEAGEGGEGGEAGGGGHGLTKQFWKLRTAFSTANALASSVSLSSSSRSFPAVSSTAVQVPPKASSSSAAASSVAAVDPIAHATTKAPLTGVAAQCPVAFKTLDETRDRVCASASESPLLAIVQCTLNGVMLEFEQESLQCETFRASMPVKDVFGGNAEKAKLLARPLVFVDRSDAAYRAPADLENMLEQQAGLFMDTPEILAAIGHLPQLPTPFNLPMVYFVDPAHHEHSLTPTTHKQSDGTYRIRLLIPDGNYALNWLLNVNGLCGPEYAMLETELSLMRSDGWFSLAEVCRQRLSVWCDMRPRERFLAYVNDIDFGHHDAGLAGLVVTDQRVIYRKHHHHGQIDLAKTGTLRFKRQEGFILVVHEPDSGSPSAKLIRMSEANLPKLMDALANRGQLHLAPP